MNRNLLVPVLFAIVYVTSSSSLAQDYERVAPKLPEKPASPLITPPPIQKSEGASAEKLSVKLRSLVFVSGTDHFRPAGLADTTPSGIDASDVPLLNTQEFKDDVESFIGKTFSFADLEHIRLAANGWLRKHKRPFVDITIPEQNITNGVVQVVVTQYRVGQVNVSGARYFSQDQIRSLSGITPGQMLDIDDLNTDMNRLNQNPFLNVDAVFSPGNKTGLTDVTLNAADRFPFRFYAGYDNLGVRNMDINEFNLGVNWGDFLGLGQVLSYQYTRTFNGRFLSHSVSDVIPLPWQDKILIFGSYERQVPNITSIFSSVGHSGQASIRYVVDLPRTESFTEDLQIGYDFKTTDNNLDFLGYNIFSTQAEVDQFPVVYEASLSDAWGMTTIQNIFVYSPGNLTGGNTTDAHRTLVSHSRANYVYDRFQLTRATTLPANFSAITRATVQQANVNIPYSEQLGGGGVGSARGYYTDTALGSNGVLASQELRLPAFSPIAMSGIAINDQAQFGIFVDYAHLKQVTPIADMPVVVDLMSTGVEAHYSVGQYFDVQFDMGWRLRTTSSQPSNGAFGQIAVTIGY